MATIRAKRWMPPWWLPLLLMALSIWPYLSMPVDTLTSQAIYDGLILSAVIFLAIAGRSLGGRQSAPAWLFSAAAFVYLVGDLSWYAIYYHYGEPPQSASVADVGYAGYYLVLAAGFLWLLRVRSPGRDLAGLMDTLIVATGLSMLIWVYLVLPIASSSAFSWIGWAVSVSYPIFDIAMLFVMAKLVTAPGPKPFSYGLLITALVLLLAADTWYGFHLADGSFVAGGILDLSWPLVFLLIAAAFLHPSAPTMLEPVSAQPTTRSGFRFIVLAAAMLIPTVVAALATTQAQKAVALASGILVFGLVVARFWQMAGELDHAHRRFRALVQNAEDLIFVINDAGAVTYCSPSACELIGQETPLLERLVPEDRARLAANTSLEPGDSQVLDLRLHPAQGPLRHYSAVLTNLTADADVRGYVLNLRDVTDRVRLEGELRYQALHDQLTGLPNRALYADRIGHALDRCRRDGGSLAVLSIDLDRFKQTNDLYGHAAGDSVLCEVSRAMEECVRAYDTVARVGGDEFGVLLTEVASAQEVAAIADRLRQHVARGDISCSIGAVIGDGRSSTEALTSAADHALYQAKRGGRDRCVIAADVHVAG